MEITSIPICSYCEYNQALGVFRNKWICGKCYMRFADKFQQERNKILDIMEEQVKKEINDNR